MFDFLTGGNKAGIMMYTYKHNAIMRAVMVRKQIQMEENQIRWLRERARQRGVSVSQLIREGVDFYRKFEDRLPEEKKKKALAAVGKYSSGASDTSQRHDDHLAAAYQGSS